jgi:nonribosomal peptide synthetase DhbF
VSAEDQDLLAKIQQVIVSHPDVREAAVIALSAGPRNQFLAAVVPVAFASGPEIREYLWQRLGDDSPSIIALLPELPRNIHGAVDTQELGRAFLDGNLTACSYAAPRTPLERTLAGIFREVLGVPRVGLDDQFFDLGGDSVRAVQLTNLIAERTGIHLPPEEFFEAATIRNLAHCAGT